MLRFPPKYLILRFDILMQAGLNFNSFCRIKKNLEFSQQLMLVYNPHNYGL
jgi:hypothetical protein